MLHTEYLKIKKKGAEKPGQEAEINQTIDKSIC